MVESGAVRNVMTFADEVVVDLVRELESSDPPLPFVTPAELRERIAARA